MSRRDALIAKFRTITGARAARVRGALDARAETQASEVARELHTLKGEAQLLGFVAISGVARELEGLFASAEPDTFLPSPRAVELILDGLDLIDALRTRPADDPQALAELEAFAARARGGSGSDGPLHSNLLDSRRPG